MQTSAGRDRFGGVPPVVLLIGEALFFVAEAVACFRAELTIAFGKAESPCARV
jgi:hypothetical protein